MEHPDSVDRQEIDFGKKVFTTNVIFLIFITLIFTVGFKQLDNQVSFSSSQAALGNFIGFVSLFILLVYTVHIFFSIISGKENYNRRWGFLW